MFVWLREQGFESSIDKVFQKEKLVNSKTIKYTVLHEEVSSAGVVGSVTKKKKVL
jgi:hypothetical protein